MRFPAPCFIVAFVIGPVLVPAVTASSASAQTIRGLLLESATERPIDLGEVVMLRVNGDTVAAALSDENGLFSLTAPEAGNYRVVAIAFGYLGRGAGPFELDDDALRVVHLTLIPAPVPIEGIDVETAPIVITDDALLANGFYERMMEGRGQFLTPLDIEKSEARFTPHLFRGLKYVRPQYGAAPWQTWVRLWSPFGRGTCLPRVFVDDVWMNKTRFELYAEGLGLEDVVPQESIKAVELYWGLQAPLRYGAPDGPDNPGMCGVILIWTKRGG